MRTVVLDSSSAGLDGVLARRRAAGLDRLDEVWEGVLHLVPAPSGERAELAQQLAEILGPAARAAGLVPDMGEFHLGTSDLDFRVPDGGYEPLDGSRLIALDAAGLARRIDWP